MTVKISGDYLRGEMAKRGWTQRQMAKAVGLSQPSVSRILRGGSMWGMTAIRIASVLRATEPDNSESDGCRSC